MKKTPAIDVAELVDLEGPDRQPAAARAEVVDAVEGAGHMDGDPLVPHGPVGTQTLAIGHLFVGHVVHSTTGPTSPLSPPYSGRPWPVPGRPIASRPTPYRCSSSATAIR
jgi:hypothetical protein